MEDHLNRGRQVFVFEVNAGAQTQQIVSLLDPATAFQHGLPTEAVLGVLRPGAAGDRAITPERFQENPAFVRYLAALISQRIHAVEGIRRAAARQREGHVYVIDARTPRPDGEVPPVDVIGGVRIQAGTLVPASYQHNPNHRLLTGNGFFRLPPELETVLRADVRARCIPPR